MITNSAKYKIFFSLCIGILFFDQFTKLLVNQYQVHFSSFFLTLEKSYNKGIILGSFGDISPLIRIVFLSCLGIYLNLLFSVFLYFFKNKNLFFLKIGLSLILTGINGNLIDRIRFGYVIDFIKLELPFLKNIVFNLADLSLIAGTTIFISCLFIYSDELWRPHNQRKTFLISPKYQLTTTLFFAVNTLFFSLTVQVFGYTYLKSYLGENHQLLSTFIIGNIFLTIVFMGLQLFLGLILTHKTAGPILRLKNFSEGLNSDLSKDENILEFKLRQGDFHSELEDIAKSLVQKK